MKYKAVFFDFDGTLMDTSEGIINSGVSAMNTVGIPVPENPETRKFIGPPLMDCFRIVYGVSDRETLNRLVDEYRSFYHKTGMYQSTFYPHIVDVLKQLKEKGYKLGVASMKGDSVVKRACEVFELTQYFDYCGGMIDDETDTKSEIIKRGIKTFGLSCSDCVLVGDTPIDCDGAKKAGVDFIKVGWGFGYTPSDEGVINDALDILKIV